MQARDLQTWEEFESELLVLRDRRETRKGETSLHVSNLLFRGQHNASWTLTTTLERQGKGPLTLRQYYRLICAAKPHIETLTGSQWIVPEYPEYEKWLAENNTAMPGRFPGYEYMVYLRHHGFPSPLLDWTRSPYVAAYFAFAHAIPTEGQVSLYVYWEYPGSGKGYSSNEPHIHGMGPYVRTHKRHFLQQSEYTICLVHAKDWTYAAHEGAFAREEETQDLLWKFNIPSSERLKVLRLLDERNINAFSLFSSEDSLMETLSMRELHFREREL